MSGSRPPQMRAGVPQIGKRVQVCRMPSRFVSQAQDGADDNNKHEQVWNFVQFS